MNALRKLEFLRNGILASIAFVGIGCMMSFNKALLPYFICFFLVVVPMVRGWSKRLKGFTKSSLFLLSLMFFWYLLGLSWSESLQDGWKDIEVKLSLLFVPIMAYTIKEYFLQYRIIIKRVYVYANLVAIFICILIAIQNSYTNGEFAPSIYPGEFQSWSFMELFIQGHTYFNYSSFSYFIHPSYFALNICMAIAFQAELCIKKWDKISTFVRSLHLLVLMLLVGSIFMLQSRAGIIALIFLLAYGTILLLRSKKHLWLKVFSIVFIFAFLSSFVLQSGRFNQIFKNAEGISYEELKNSNTRLVLWKHALSLIKQSPITGYGTGDTKKLLSERASEQKEIFPDGIEYNSHNEILETALKLGVLGGVFLLFVIFFPLFRRSEVANKHLYIAFVIIIMTNFMFESMLNRINGVIFFTYFYSFLAIEDIRLNGEQKN